MNCQLSKDKKENVVFVLGWLSTKDRVRSAGADTSIRLNYKALWFSNHYTITRSSSRQKEKTNHIELIKIGQKS